MNTEQFHTIINRTTELLSPQIAWLIFVLALILTFLFSVALFYHWKVYASVHHKKLAMAEKVYLVVTILLVISSIVPLILYTI